MEENKINYNQYLERLIEIEQAILALQKEKQQLLEAGGIKYRMAVQKEGEIRNLETERERIYNGTQTDYLLQQEKQNELKEAKQNLEDLGITQFAKRKKLIKEIKSLESSKNKG